MIARARSRISHRARHARERFGLEDLYRELATHRAGDARSALAEEQDPERRFAESAAALEDAAGVLHHATATYTTPGAEAARRLHAHAAALEATAARFELAADLTRARRAR